MDKTQLKVKLAEEVLPPKGDQVVRLENGQVKFTKNYDYDLAERILNYLEVEGVKLYYGKDL